MSVSGKDTRDLFFCKNGYPDMHETIEIAQEKVEQIKIGSRTYLLLGTAHISQQSVDKVKLVIETVQPDTVCVELDEQRYKSLTDKKKWENLNIIQVIKKKQVPYLIVNLVLASFQKRMGLQTGVKPGAELAAAAEMAKEHGCHLELVDRDLRTTLLRAWRKTSLWRKMMLLSTLFASLFERNEINEEELAKLQQSDTLSTMLDEMGDLLPSVKEILVDERDRCMADGIRNAPGETIVAVMGAAHMPGVINWLPQQQNADELAEMNSIPTKSPLSKLIPWLIPAIIMVIFIAGFFFGDRSQMGEAAIVWILTNGILSAIGAAAALAHPVTIATAFVAAPITSLNPTIGAGMVTGLVQAFMAPPTVGNMEKVGDDLETIKGWWKNRLTRILLVFLFSSIGSAIGTFLAGYWLIDLFS